MQKRIHLILLVTALVLLVSACGQGTGSEPEVVQAPEPTAEPTPTQESALLAALTDLPQVAMMEELTVGETRVAVTSLRFQESISMGAMGNMTLDDPNLIFMDVQISITNLGETAADFEEGASGISIFELVGSDGEAYGKLGTVRDSIVNPGETIATSVTFVIRRDRIENAQLVVTDMFSETAGTVLLSLDPPEAPAEDVELSSPTCPSRLLGMFEFSSDSGTESTLQQLAAMLTETMGCTVELGLVNLEGFAPMFMAGEADFALLPFSVYVSAGNINVSPFLIPSLGEENNFYYRGGFFARNDSGAESLADLEGTTFAYTAPGDNIGYLMPRGMLAQEGFNVNTFFAGTEAYGYSYTDMITAVVDGEAGAGVFWVNEQTDARVMVEDVIPDIWDITEIIAQTPRVPYMLLVVRDGLAEETREGLRDAFLQVIGEAEGQDLLYALAEITGFVEPDETLGEAVELIRYAEGLSDQFGDWPQTAR